MLVRPETSIAFSPAAAQLRWSTPEARTRYLTKRRTRAWRQRKKHTNKSKGQRRCYRVRMWDTDVIALLNDWEPAQQRDDQLTPQELREHFDQKWMDVAEGVIEQAALSAIKKKTKLS